MLADTILDQFTSDLDLAAALTFFTALVLFLLAATAWLCERQQPPFRTVTIDLDLGDFVDEPQLEPMSDFDRWRTAYVLGEPISRDDSAWWENELRSYGEPVA